MVENTIQSLLLTALSLIVVLIVWLLTSRFFCSQREQKHALGVAFVVLILIWILHLFLTVVLNIKNIFPFSAALALFAPLSLYFVMLVLRGEGQEPGDETVIDNKSEKECAEFPTVSWDLSDFDFAVMSRADLRAYPEERIQYQKASLPVRSVDLKLPFLVKPELRPVPEQKMVGKNFETIYSKARLLGDKGVWPIAARLFEEAASYTDNPLQKKMAFTQAISSYRQAGRVDKAKHIELKIIELVSRTSAPGSDAQRIAL